MSSRGRGSRGYGGSRGGYRGSGGYRGGRGGGRGGSYSMGAVDRYSAAERYSRSTRHDDVSYKKSYRSEAPSYSSREHGGRTGSPDRKRMRIEGSGRRSHEAVGQYVSDYGGRHESYDRRSYIETRRSPAREYGGGYKKDLEPPTSHPRSPRRSYRARPPRSSFRGTTRGSRRILSRASDFSRRIRQAKARSVLAATQASSSSEAEENWDKEEKKTTKTEEESPTANKVKVKKEKPEGEAEVEGGDATDKEGRAGSGDEAETVENEESNQLLRQRQYIKLTCPHCKEKALTFKAYTRHLQSRKHQHVMDEVAMKLKTMLQRMRSSQRVNQRALDNEPETSLSEQLFCPLCKLIYRSSKEEHYLSSEHKNMKKFLLPFCKSCNVTLKAPMMYEHHICSLEHIKKKAVTPKKAVKVEAGSGEEGMDVDLENFMTLDSVGDVDEVDDDSADGEKKEGESGESKPKQPVNFGSEHIKKVEVYFCELCKFYLPRSSGELGIRRHCRVRAHLNKYVRYRDHRTLRKQAEKIHRMYQQSKEVKKEPTEETAADEDAAKAEGKTATVGDTVKTEPRTGGAAKENGRSAEGEAMWSEEVDQELGDLLRDVDQPHKSSDDEDDSNTGRYDRFRKSDKKVEGAAVVNEDADTPKKEALATNGTSEAKA